MIYEKEYDLNTEERRTLLFLTGGLRIIDRRDITKEDIWNLQEFFGLNNTNKIILRCIIKRDKVVIKIMERQDANKRDSKN